MYGTNAIYDRSINKVLGVKIALGGLTRPDLVNKSTTEVWEIKPVGSYLAGSAQLGYYLLLSDAHNPL